MNAETKRYNIERAIIIDDSDVDLMIAQSIMARNGFATHILTMHSGFEALKYLNDPINENKLPKIIFLDINMPGMDGFDFLTAYARCHQSVKDYCKIVALTSSMHPRDFQAMQKNPYVIRFIPKPLTVDHLEAVGHEIT